MSDNINNALELIVNFGPNCMLGICCPPKRQAEVLAAAINQDLGWDSDARFAAEKAAGTSVASWILNHFDLAPKDSITPLLRKAGELARNE